MPRASKTLHDRLADTGRTARRVRVAVDNLALLAGDTNRPITFSDLAAALGMGLHDASKAVRVLRHSGLVERVVVAGDFNRSKYELTRLAQRLLAQHPVSTSGAARIDLFSDALASAAAHNNAARLSRVTGLNLTAAVGLSHSLATSSQAAFTLVVTVMVLPVPALAEEIAGLLRQVGKLATDHARVSLVLESV
jgi:DNA-binding MarR family transcriptional regulator